MHSYIFFLLVFIFIFSGLDPTNPAQSLTQANEPAGQRHAPRVRAKWKAN